MLRRSKVEAAKGKAASASALAMQLAQDKRFRKKVVSAIKHSDAVGRRTRGSLGITGAIARLASDEALRNELKSARTDLQRAYARLERKRRSHKLRNVMALAGLGSLAGLPQVRRRLVTAFESVTERARPAAEPAHSTPSSSGRSGRPHSLEDLTKEELYERAQQADIPGRSEMSKDELVSALRARS